MKGWRGVRGGVGWGGERNRYSTVSSGASRYPMTLMTQGSFVDSWGWGGSRQSWMPAKSSDPSAAMCDYIAANVLVLLDLYCTS